MERADDLAAELHDAPVVEHGLLDAAAGPLARLEHFDVGAGGREIACGGEAGQPRAEDEDVAAHLRTCACSGFHATFTRSPSSQRSSDRARARFCSSATSRDSGPSSMISCVAVPR